LRSYDTGLALWRLSSAETRQALEKYLELGPDGPHAADAWQMLDFAAK
jgi:hypothetical protein